MYLTQVLKSGFESESGLEFSGFRMWHFLPLIVQDFVGARWFPPILVSQWFQPMNRAKTENKFDFDSVRSNS